MIKNNKPYRVQFKLAQFLLMLALMLLNPIQAFNAFAKEANSEFMTRMAVFPFQNLTGDRALDWVSIALQESMNVDLWYLPVGWVEPLPYFYKELKNKCPDMAIECVASLAEADWFEISKNKGYQDFISGTYRSQGDKFEIQFYLINVENKTHIAHHKVITRLEGLTEASSDALIHLMKQVNLTLTNQLKEYVKYPETENVTALKNNALGFWAQQQYSIAGNDHEKQVLEKSWKAFLQKATQADAHYANAWNNLGWYFYILNNKEQAKQSFEHAASANPQHPDALDGLANIYRDQNDQSQYIKYLEKISQISGSMPNLISSLADLYRETGEYAKAEPLYQRALAIVEEVLGPKHADTATSLNNLGVLYYSQGHYAKAEPLSQRVLAIREEVLGPKHADTATSLNNLAVLYQTQGHYAKAEPLYQRALAIVDEVLGPKHASTVTSLNNLAELYRVQGHYAKAEPLYQRALAIREEVLGPKHADTVTSLNNLAGLYESQGDYAKAEPLYQRALAIREEVLGHKHADTAMSLNNLAVLYTTQGHYAKAEPLYQRALAIVDEVLGAKHADTVTSLNNLAGLYETQGHYEKAEPLYQRALAIREEVLGPKHELTATSLNNLARLYKSQGHYVKAEPLYQRTLAIREKVLGSKHADTATGLNNLAELYRAQGRYAKAEPLYQRALAIREEVLGPKHASTAMSLNNLAALYSAQGHYAKAESLYQRALAIFEEVLGPKHELTATSLNNLATLYEIQGHYTKAEPLFQRALTIYEEVLGSRHADTATGLNNLAELYRAQGRYAKAEPLYQRALAIREEVLGPKHADTAGSLNNLALLYEIQGHYDKAEPPFQRALAIREEVLGPKHADTAGSLNNLALLYEAQGHYAKAEPLYQRALAIREEVLGPKHASTAESLNNLAYLYFTQGHYAQAESLLQRALVIHEEVLGPKHANTATSLNNLAKLYYFQGHYAKAKPLFQRALAIYEEALGNGHPDTANVLLNYAQLHYAQDQVTPAIFYGKQGINVLQASRESNQQLDKELRKSFLDSKESDYRTVADWLLEAGRLAEAEQVLAMLKEDEQVQYLRRNQASAKRFDTRAQCTTWEEKHCQRYQQLSTELRETGKTLQDLAKDKSEQAQEKARLDDLNQQLKVRNAAFNQGLVEINGTLKALQVDPEYKIHLEKDVLQRSNRLRRSLKELGNGAVTLHYLLLENTVKIILTTPDKQLTRSSDVKLTALRRKVGLMRQAILRKQEQADLMELSQELYQLLIAPVADELAAAQAKTLMVSLDGILRYLPFAALHDGKQFLIERYALNLQTLAAKTDLQDPPQSNWRISGFGVSRAAEVMEPGTLRPIRFDALPFVQNELKAIIRQHSNDQGILPGEIYLDDTFSKQQLIKTLTQSGSSAVFHIGSHFELRPGDNSRSFLLLGQNTILTMADAFDENLDFSGADLVTLSACDTAMGADNALSNGAEIESFGVLVQELGAKSVLATLWPVIDESTSVFMQRFYQLREQKKLTKAEALRQAQRSMIDSGTNFAQPYYWAPFVLMGNWL